MSAEGYASVFAAKNAERKAGRKHGDRKEQIEARRLRRARLGVRGAFGDAARSDWNDMVYGTTGAAK